MNNSENSIAATAIISPFAVIGKGNTIGEYVVIEDNVRIGDNNYIGAFACIGSPAEYAAPPEGSRPGPVIIGDGNTIREYVCVNSSILTGSTRIGNGCYIMDKSHIAHDCKIRDGVRLAAGVMLCGSVTIGEESRIGPNSTVLQRHSIGKYCQVGIGSIVTEDIPDFQTWVNFTRAKYLEPNHIGIERFKLKYNGQE